MPVIFFFMTFAVSNVEPLLNDLVRSRQHVRWNRQADLLGRFQIDDELKLRWLLHRQIGGLGTFQDLVHICSGPPEHFGDYLKSEIAKFARVVKEAKISAQ